jgi:transcriptional regulator with XRE-family HTH domain
MAGKNPVSSTHGHFGERLSSLREASGYSQSKLGKRAGISQRMMAYYESRAALPPGHVLSGLAEALVISVDELVGNAPSATVKPKRTRASQRLLRRLIEMEKLPLKDKRELLSIIDTYLEKHRLAQRTAH